MVLRFSTAEDEDAGKVIIHLTKPPRFEIEHCTTSLTDFLVQYYSPNIRDSFSWAITQIRKPNELRLLVHLHSNKSYRKSTKFADFLLSDETCEGDNWKTYWSRSVARMNFEADDDASDIYRLGEQILLFLRKNNKPTIFIRNRELAKML